MASTAADLAWPVDETYVPSDWADHRYRNPPSAEPGTDIASAYGAQCRASGPGTVHRIQSSSSGGTGRFIEIRLDDGRALRYLHMDAIYVGTGHRVGTGAVIGATGASGYGSNWYYGPHVHVTLLPTWTTSLAASVDFENYIAKPTPPEPTPPPITDEDEEMVYYIESNGDALNGVIKKGWILAYTPGRPIKVLSSQEWNLISYFADKQPYIKTAWKPADVDSLIKSNGLIETFDYKPGNSPSGRLRYSKSDARYPVSVAPPTTTPPPAES